MTSAAAKPSADRLPADVAVIRDEAAEFKRHRGQRVRTRDLWSRQATRLQQATRRIQVEDDGDTIRLGALSPGCRACKDGKWDCLFLSLRCNLSCGFCLTPCSLASPPAISALGDDLDALCAHYARNGIIGVGFSGGEPLLDPQRLLSYLSMLRQRRPDLYLWVYTNGTLLTAALITALAEAGLDELRFNMAATGYDHGGVTTMLYHAAARLPSVTVEIPAIPEDAGPLQKAIPVWSRAGVTYLNIHELVYEPGSPSEAMPGLRERCRMPDGHICEFNPHSADLALKVMRAADACAPPLAVNYCSLGNKARQLRGRRRMLAPDTLQPYERLCPDGQAECVCCYNETCYTFVHPVKAADSMRIGAGFGFALIRRILPLHRGGDGQWTAFDIIHPAEGA